MSTMIDELRASMRSAQVFGTGKYFQPGQYDLEVIKLFYKRSIEEGTAKENIICEFKVLTSTNPETEVSSTVSSVFAFKHQGWLSRFKALTLALIGVDPDAKIPAAAEEAATDIYVCLRDDTERTRLGLPENFMAGKKVKVEAFQGKSRKGTPVTNMKWTPFVEAA
jgi:hypothetical protein